MGDLVFSYLRTSKTEEGAEEAQTQTSAVPPPAPKRGHPVYKVSPNNVAPHSGRDIRFIYLL